MAQYEATAPKHHWSGWYAAYIVAREQGRTPEEAAKDGAAAHGAGPPVRARHRSRRRLSRLRAFGPPRHAPHALGVAGRRSAGAGAVPRRFLSERPEATRRAPATAPRDAGGLLPSRDDFDRQPGRDERVPRWRRRPLDVSLGPRAQAAEGSRHRGIHRPAAQSDDPAHAGARARPA